MSKFSDEISKVFPLDPSEMYDTSIGLPFAHSTSCLKALDILEQGILAPTIDGKIKADEPHLYFFYGRAAYPIQKGESPRGDYSYFTFCFLFKSKLDKISYVFPFDSGAFLRGLYPPFPKGDYNLLDFLMPSDLESINEYIIRIFGNQNNYIHGTTSRESANIDIDTPFEVSGFWNMVTNKLPQKVDSRCKTVETVSTVNITLDDDALVAVVMPEILRDSKRVKDFLDRNPSIDVISYPCFFGDTDDSYYGVVREKVHDYIYKNGLVKE